MKIITIHNQRITSRGRLQKIKPIVQGRSVVHHGGMVYNMEKCGKHRKKISHDRAENQAL